MLQAGLFGSAQTFTFNLYEVTNPGFAATRRTLDTIVVTGSNIRRVDIYTRVPATTHAFAFLPHGSNLAHGAMRARFSESALWDADSTLAAGAARTVRVRLPDNLTRWRILAWANDVDDTFALAQATVAASLPIEARAELPTRLFPGDVAQFGANVRNHGAAPRTLQMQLTASGAGVSASTAASASLAPHAQQRLTLLALPSTVGSIEVETRAGDAAAGDALASSVEVRKALAWYRQGASSFATLLLPAPGGDDQVIARLWRHCLTWSQCEASAPQFLLGRLQVALSSPVVYAWSYDSMRDGSSGRPTRRTNHYGNYDQQLPDALIRTIDICTGARFRSCTLCCTE